MIRTEGVAMFGFVERQANLMKRYWAWEVVWIVYSLVSVLSIGFLASGLGSLGAGRFDLRAAQLYLLIGSLLWAYLSMVFTEISLAITWERWEGTIEYTFMAPIRRQTHLLGICLFGLVYSALRSVVILAVAQWLFRLDLSRADLLSALAVLAVSTIPLVGLGLLAAVLPLISPEKGEQMGVAVQGMVLLVSGVYYPLSVLPAPLQALGYVSPMTYTLDGVRGALLAGRHLDAQLPTLLVLLLLGLVLVPAGMWTFAWAERRAKRLGLLKRSG